MKDPMISEVKNILRRHNIQHEELETLDLIAKIRDKLSLILVRWDMRNIKPQEVRRAGAVARALRASLFAISEVSGNERLVDDTAYERQGLSVINLETFERILRGEKVYVKKRRGKFVVSVNAERLRKARVERGMSQGELAEMLGVSRKAVYEYERANMDVSVEVAARLVELFGTEVLQEVDLLKEYEGTAIDERVHLPEERKIAEATGGFHLSKGPADVVSQSAVFVIKHHRGGSNLEDFAKLAKMVSVKKIMVKFNDAPKELEDVSEIYACQDVEGVLKLLKGDETRAR